MERKISFAFLAIVSAILGSICCIGPIVAAITGFMTFSLFHKFAPLRPYILGVAFISIALGFYQIYFRKGDKCCEVDKSNVNSYKIWSRNISKFMLWGALVFILLSFVLPYAVRVGEKWSRNISNSGGSGLVEHLKNPVKITLKISGLDCESCAVSVKKVLTEFGGRNFVFDFKNEEVTFEIESDGDIQTKIQKRINEIGFEVVGFVVVNEKNGGDKQ